MTPVTASRLPPWRRTTIIQLRVRYVTIIALCMLAHGALAQQQSKPEDRPIASEDARGRDDLDVTMQIIVDPDAKLPDEVVRRIPLPERKSAPASQSSADSSGKQDEAGAREAQQLGREVSQSAKERAKEAREQREQARRAAAEERRRERGNPEPPPRDPPGRPPRN